MPIFMKPLENLFQKLPQSRFPYCLSISKQVNINIIHVRVPYRENTKIPFSSC